MPKINDIHTIIVAAANANTSAHTYTEVYASAAATPTINGVAVTMAAGSALSIWVRTISATANVFVLGDPIDVAQGSTNLTGL